MCAQVFSESMVESHEMDINSCTYVHVFKTLSDICPHLESLNGKGSAHCHFYTI